MKIRPQFTLRSNIIWTIWSAIPKCTVARLFFLCIGEEITWVWGHQPLQLSSAAMNISPQHLPRYHAVNIMRRLIRGTESAWCPSVASSHCGRSIICFRWSEALEQSPGRHPICSITACVPEKTWNTFISAIVPRHYYVVYFWFDVATVVLEAIFYLGHYNKFNVM